MLVNILPFLSLSINFISLANPSHFSENKDLCLQCSLDVRNSIRQYGTLTLLSLKERKSFVSSHECTRINKKDSGHVAEFSFSEKKNIFF